MIKRSNLAKFFDGLNYAGAMLTFLAALGVIASTTRRAAAYPFLLPLVCVAFGIGQFLLVIAAVGLTRVRFRLKIVAALVGLYTLLSVWDVISILIGLPFIVLTVILGPFMTVVFVLSCVLLGMYLVQDVIGYDLKGYVSILKNPAQAFVALLALVVSLLITVWHLGHESADWAVEKAGDLSVRWRKRIQEMIDEIVARSAI